MRNYNYEANEDSIGGGWENIGVAVDRWNEYIATVLAEATTDEMIENGDEPIITVSPGIAQNASEWAWEQFCARSAGDSEEECDKLGDELRAKLNL